MRRQLRFLGVVGSITLFVPLGVRPLQLARGSDEPGREQRNPDGQTQVGVGASSKNWTTAVEPKPLSQNVKKGLDWLVEHQLPGGGWGQGEESAQMHGNEALKDTPNVADTCIALLALIRSGSTPREGLYKDAIVKGVRYVRTQVDESDSQSISVTRVQGTRVQQKLGPNIDTFLASILLAEVKGRMPDDASEKAADLALHKVLGKIERHQKEDGAFDGQGWAPILAQAMCGKGINRARQAGAKVANFALARAENGAKLAFAASKPIAAGAASRPTTAGDVRAYSRAPVTVGTSGLMAGGMAGMGGAAGVELYSRAASLGVLCDSVNTNNVVAEGLRDKAANSKDAKERASAKEQLAQIADAERVHGEAQAALVARLGDPRFLAGFGSNGGEEFLSYMNIAESLVVKGGDEWKRWDSDMTKNLNRVQNDDGSWSGHHCITGRTFCTSTALLVLMADRTPIPVGGIKAEARPTPK